MNDPTSFTRRCNILMVLLCAGCVISFALSFRGGEVNMLGFPILFFLAALMQFLNAWQRFRRDFRGRNQKAAGFGFLLAGLFLLILTYVTILCVW